MNSTASRIPEKPDPRTPRPDARPQVTGLILAGGRARRMAGRDKGLLPLAGRPLAQYALSALAPQVQRLLISANRNRERYAAFGYPVIEDDLADFAGPLAGVASALAVCQTPYVATAPCDSPLLAPDLVARLLQALRAADGAMLSVARDGERLQPVFALLDRRLYPSLQAYLAAGGRKIDPWLRQERAVEVDFSDRPRMFRNINTPEERNALETELKTERKAATAQSGAEAPPAAAGGAG
ncbi:MAG: molybdenum cofactor guanylyltransferase [Gammaproteobacteria bacterium]|nr:molybdenum cofactor guanylyltransferase [Gammaproteobacteria bacterium]